MKRFVAALVVALLVAACGGGATGGTIAGTVVIPGDYASWAPTEQTCWGAGGYGDLAEGAQVVVSDPEGAVIGTGALEAGVWTSYTSPSNPSRCSFAFSVADLPDVAFYSVEVSHRGQVTYSRADLEATSWTVELSLGS
jgi:hypothetical protein